MLWANSICRHADVVHHVDLVADQQLARVLGRVLAHLTEPVAHVIKRALTQRASSLHELRSKQAR